MFCVNRGTSGGENTVRPSGREQTIDSDAEAKLLAAGRQPMRDVLIIRDTGMRPEEVFRIRVENIDWNRWLIFNPHGKTRASRRHVPISHRVFDLLVVRCGERPEGWSRFASISSFR